MQANDQYVNQLFLPFFGFSIFNETQQQQKLITKMEAALTKRKAHSSLIELSNEYANH